MRDLTSALSKSCIALDLELVEVPACDSARFRGDSCIPVCARALKGYDNFEEYGIQAIVF